jgi:hypothetical protein
MNWDAIGAIGEILGAGAVIATLLYLARQINDSARAARSAAVTDATNAIQALYLELGSNSRTSEHFLNGMTSYDSMSEPEQFQWLMLLHSFFLAFQRSFFLAREGTLDVGFRDSIGTAISAVNHLPGTKRYWEQRRAFFQPEFIDWVEELLAQEPITDMHPYHRRAGMRADS